jgi:hypothetical protein
LTREIGGIHSRKRAQQENRTDTAGRVLDEAGTLSVAHTDCDIYESVRYSYEACKSRMVTNGYVVFDGSTASSCIGDRSRREIRDCA